VVSRTEFLGSVPAGNGAFNSAILFVYPQETTVVSIARSFAEYRYSKFVVRLVPRASSTTLGTGFSGFQLSPPSAITNMAHAAALQGFKVGPPHGIRQIMSRLDAAGRARRWLRVVQTDLTSAQSIDPDIVQAWLTVGVEGVQSGVVGFDIHVDYTIHFRGNSDFGVPIGTSTSAPSVLPMTRAGLSTSNASTSASVPAGGLHTPSASMTSFYPSMSRSGQLQVSTGPGP